MTPSPVHEDVLLLALHPEKGTIPLGPEARLAVAGAVLAELLLRGVLVLDGEGRGARIAVRPGSAGTGDRVLDDLVGRIRIARPAALGRWGRRLGRRAVLHDIALGLSRRGILRREERPFLLFFRRSAYRQADQGRRSAAVARVAAAVEGHGPPAPRDAVLAGLVAAAGLERKVLDRTQRKGRRARLRALAAAEPLLASAAPEARAAAHAVTWTGKAVRAARASAAAG